MVVVVAGVFYYINYRSSVRERAIAQLEQVQATLATGDRETAKTQLQQYIDAFDGTVYALEARLTLGQALLEDGNAEEAIQVLAPAVRTMDDQPIGIQAAFLMASAYEQAGRKDDAEQLLLRIANTSDLTFQVREALSGAARIREDQGNCQGRPISTARFLPPWKPTTRTARTGRCSWPRLPPTLPPERGRARRPPGPHSTVLLVRSQNVV